MPSVVLTPQRGTRTARVDGCRLFGCLRAGRETAGHVSTGEGSVLQAKVWTRGQSKARSRPRSCILRLAPAASSSVHCTVRSLGMGMHMPLLHSSWHPAGEQAKSCDAPTMGTTGLFARGRSHLLDRSTCPSNFRARGTHGRWHMSLLGTLHVRLWPSHPCMPCQIHPSEPTPHSSLSGPFVARLRLKGAAGRRRGAGPGTAVRSRTPSAACFQEKHTLGPNRPRLKAMQAVTGSSSNLACTVAGSADEVQETTPRAAFFRCPRRATCPSLSSRGFPSRPLAKVRTAVATRRGGASRTPGSAVGGAALFPFCCLLFPRPRPVDPARHRNCCQPGFHSPIRPCRERGRTRAGCTTTATLLCAFGGVQ